jgi:hypothetical protein
MDQSLELGQKMREHEKHSKTAKAVFVAHEF